MPTDLSAAAQSLRQTASELARLWATQRLSAVDRYGRILSDYGAGRATGRDAAQAYAKLAMEEAVHYQSDAFGIATDYAKAVAQAAGLSIGTRQATARQTVQQTARRTVIDLDISGPIGGAASRDFVLENPHDSAAQIRFVATNFRDGEAEVKAKPLFAPARIDIPAAGEQVVSVRVKLDPRKFQAGHRYCANVAVDGFDDMVLRVHLTVNEAA